MLTVKQPSTYGYTSVHDLPTPPSTSRPSPPLLYQEKSYRQLPALRRSHSPASHSMSTPHRGLPPPAAMTLPPQQPTSAGPPPPTHHHSNPPPPPPPGHQSGQSWTALPAPTNQWHEDSMRNWLQARAEEEKTKQEEEKTRQESLRLEQRKIEMDMLQQSLRGGIPPPMVPLVFAGMGGGGILPQAALEWAQQYMNSAQGSHPQLMPPQPVSPHHQRDQPALSQYSAAAPAPASAQAPQGAYGQHPGSPNRARGQTIGGPMVHPMAGSSLPSLNTNMPPGAPPAPRQAQATLPGHVDQQEPSPGIYFHHWQPPTSQAAGSSNRPGTPSGDAPKKRKATGPLSSSNEQRLRSPPPFAQSSNSAASRRGHKRQKSDLSWYQPSPAAAHERGDDSDRPSRANSPRQQPSRPSSSRGRSRSEVGKHSVSSMLSAEPAEGPFEARARSWQEAESSSHYRRGDRRVKQGSPVESQRGKDSRS